MKALLITLMTTSMLLGAEVQAGSHSNDSGRSEGSQRANSHPDNVSNRSDGWITTYPDTGNTGIRETTKSPGSFTPGNKGKTYAPRGTVGTSPHMSDKAFW